MQREPKSNPLRARRRKARLKLTLKARRALFFLCVLLFTLIVCAAAWAVCTGREISAVAAGILKLLLEVLLWI
nr:MAG TPA: hypothetical protein [Caudoviricetes sp.]